MAIPRPMRLLVDTDAFCKLAAGGVLDDALVLLGVTKSECGHLPALPYMLRRGQLPKTYGAEACDSMLRAADGFAVAPDAPPVWLDRLTPVPAIDPGEAQIFAAAAAGGFVVVSGDKRALRALKNVEGFAQALGGRIVVLEAILLALCDAMGTNEVRHRVQSVTQADTMVRVCFSPGNSNPANALLSYYEDLAREVSPLVLWDPRKGSAP